MPTVLKTGGHRFFFFSNEGTEPPHVHVETAENYAKFWLETSDLAHSIGYNSSELKQLRKLVLHHSTLFLDKWHEHFDH